MNPSAEAGRRTLLRRLSLDLVGLPPSLPEIEEFLNDQSPGAYERVVDRLLASPHFGEKWARWWMDLAHYGDSDGYLTDQLRPVAWRWRQWVVDSFNRGMPFDQFTIEQIAGDLLPDAAVEQRIATGFFRNTLSNREGGADLEEFRNLQVVDRTGTFGITWLGLTLSCAECHDHKYDPVSQKEYFQLYAFFNNADEVNIVAPLPGEGEAYLVAKKAYDEKRKALLSPIERELNALQKRWEVKLLETEARPGRDHRWDRALELLGLVWGGNLGEGQLEGLNIVDTPWDERTPVQRDRLQDYFLRSGSLIDAEKFAELKIGELVGQLDELAKDLPPVSRAPTMVKHHAPRITHVHVRGDFRDKGEPVEPATPAVLHAINGSDRLALARWVVSPGNPLTARVTVNRFWQELFGRGLVATSDDFGTRGEKPSHPQLLDWLASEFVDREWDVKALMKLMVTSATYRQSSAATPGMLAADPVNRFLARHSRRRLSAELVRDNALAASGLLRRIVGGPSVRPPQPESVTAEGFENKWPVSTGEDRYRRGLYTFIQRTSPFAQFATFDLPNNNTTCTRRDRSNTPLQALTLLNDPVFFEAAQALGARLLRGPEPHEATTIADHDRLDRAYLLCLARLPRPAERRRFEQYLATQQALLREDPESARALAGDPVPGGEIVEQAAWTGAASILLNLDEFITVE